MKRWIKAMGELSRGMLFLHGYAAAAPGTMHRQPPGHAAKPVEAAPEAADTLTTRRATEPARAA